MALTNQELDSIIEKYDLKPITAQEKIDELNGKLEERKTVDVINEYGASQQQPTEWFGLTPTEFTFGIIYGIVLITIAIVGLFISYKIIRLLIKVYRKTDKWLDK